MDRPTCGTCAYFEDYETGDGECRRHAPRSAPNDGDGRDDHAVISSKHWCGEHPDFPAYLASLKEQPPAVDGLNDLDIETA